MNWICCIPVIRYQIRVILFLNYTELCSPPQIFWHTETHKIQIIFIDFRNYWLITTSLRNTTFPMILFISNMKNYQDKSHVYFSMLKLTQCLDWGPRLVNYANFFIFPYITSILLLLYANDVLIVSKNDVTNIHSAEIKFLK